MGRKMKCKEIAQHMSKWANVTQYIMGVCFSILFVLGMILFIASAVSLGDFGAFELLEIQKVKSVVIFALCLGLFIAIVSILGALGYFTLNKTLLIIFVCGISILIVLQVVCGATAFAYRDDFYDLTADGWHNLVANDTNTAVFLEEAFDCCGSYNSSDAIESKNCNATLSFSGIDVLLKTSESSEVEGCIPVIAASLKKNVNGVCIGDIVITLLEVAVIVVTGIVLYEIKRANKYTQFDNDTSLDSIRD